MKRQNLYKRKANEKSNSLKLDQAGNPFKDREEKEVRAIKSHLSMLLASYNLRNAEEKQRGLRLSSLIGLIKKDLAYANNDLNKRNNKPLSRLLKALKF